MAIQRRFCIIACLTFGMALPALAASVVNAFDRMGPPIIAGFGDLASLQAKEAPRICTPDNLLALCIKSLAAPTIPRFGSEYGYLRGTIQTASYVDTTPFRRLDGKHEREARSEPSERPELAVRLRPSQ